MRERIRIALVDDHPVVREGTAGATALEGAVGRNESGSPCESGREFGDAEPHVSRRWRRRPPASACSPRDTAPTTSPAAPHSPSSRRSGRDRLELTSQVAARSTGRGTGIDDATRARKVAVIERALTRQPLDRTDPVGVLASVGGLEIGGLAGLCLGAASHRIPVVLDGLISTAAALIAIAIALPTRDYLIAGHQSVEPGHRIALRALRLRPLLKLEMRLGEGSGAALAIPIVCAATETLATMTLLENVRPVGSGLIGVIPAEAAGPRGASAAVVHARGPR